MKSLAVKSAHFEARFEVEEEFLLADIKKSDYKGRESGKCILKKI